MPKRGRVETSLDTITYEKFNAIKYEANKQRLRNNLPELKNTGVKALLSEILHKYQEKKLLKVLTKWE